MRARAADNRHQPTQPERILWSMLRRSQLGTLKFRRQTVIGLFIVDFCCPQHKLIVEVDGESHIGRAIEDEVRTAFLEKQGYRVVRVTNDDVLCDLEAVGLAILRAAGVDIGARQSNTPHPPPSPLPEREGES
jgi:very-short-patch-repair endonuclease